VVGSVDCVDLKTDRGNVITARRPASVSGRVVDWNGNPFRAYLSLDYTKSDYDQWPDRPCAPDGSFTFSRILPDKDIRIWAGGSGGGQFAAPFGSAETTDMVLREGETKKDLVLQLGLGGGGVCGAVVDQNNKRVSTVSRMSIAWSNGRARGFTPSDHFGFPEGRKPFQIHVEAKGFKPFVSEKITLKPGEIRFVTLRLDKLGEEEPP
jgi:hypothetical protein